MSNAVKIAGITIIARLEAVTLFATAIKKKKTAEERQFFKRSKQNNFNLIVDKFKGFVKEEFYYENYKKILTSSQSM